MHLLFALMLGVQASAAPSAPPADAVSVYTRGVAAARAGDWPIAITLMNAAIAIDPSPRTYRTGTATADYFPQYYLFIAYAERGEYSTALRFYLTAGGFPQSLARDGEHALAKLTAALPDALPQKRVSQPAPAKVVLDRYADGLRALRAGDWDFAVRNLIDAVQLDGQARSYKEGVYDGAYFPQFYLFVAYLKLGDLSRARQFFDRRGDLPRSFRAEEQRYYAELVAAEKQRH